MIPDDYTLRFCTAADTDAVANMLQTTFMGLPEYGDWSRMLFNGTHPTARPEHTIVAVERASGKIVSAITGVPQTLSYAGLPLRTLNMAIVATLPEHREKGLLRAQIEMLNQWAAENGYHATTVFGIAGFYQRFGYLPLLPYSGGRRYAVTHLRRKFNTGSGDAAFRVRPAQLDDMVFLAQVHRCAAERYLISFPYDECYWKLSTFDYFESNRDQVRVIETSAGVPVGVLGHGSSGGETAGGGQDLCVLHWELLPGVSWFEVTPAVIGYLLATGEGFAQHSDEVFEDLYLALGPHHPAHRFLADIPQRSMPHTLGYIRFCDLVAFLRDMVPLLEARLARSPMCGYTRDVRIELYYRKAGGLVLSFKRGKLVDVRSQVIEGYELVVVRAEIEISEADFMRLITGQAAAADLAHNLREVNSWNGEEGLNLEFQILLEVLFPKQESFLFPCL